MKDKAQITIQKRIDKNQELLLEQLKKTPIIETACQKLGIGRATYYRWRKDNEDFAKLADDAINEGTSLINDLAENQLISSISNNNLGAITFWLRNRHPAYTTKVEITANTKRPEEEKLTPEQENLIRKALEMASLVPNKENDSEIKSNE